MSTRNAAAALVFALAPGQLLAGSTEPFALAEPQVVNFRTVVNDLMSARSTIYVGVSGSMQSTDFNGMYSQTNQNIGLRLPLSGSVSSNNFTAFFGARRSAHNFIFGAEMFAGSGSQSMTATQPFELDLRPAVPNVVTGSATQTASISSNVGLRAIAGYEFQGLRFYGTLGLTGAGVTTSMDFLGEQSAPTSRTLIGAHYGVGIEFQATREISIRLEASQSNFGGLSYPVGAGAFTGGGGAGGGTSGNTANHSLNLSATNLTIGALFEF